MEQTKPLPIADFLDTLATQGRRILPGSLRWLPHPTRKGCEVAAVIVIEGTETDGTKLHAHSTQLYGQKQAPAL